MVGQPERKAAPLFTSYSAGTREPLWSSEYMVIAKPICLRLLIQEMLRAFSLAIDNAGNNMAARMEMIAMTTSNSIKVKAQGSFFTFKRTQPNTEITPRKAFLIRSSAERPGTNNSLSTDIIGQM